MKPSLFISLSLLIISLLSACENSELAIKELTTSAGMGVETATDVIMFYSDSAVVRVKITAPLMLNYPLDARRPRREFPKGMKAEFFDAQAHPTSYLSAKKAVRYEGENRVELRDSVVVWNAKKEKLEAQELIWDEANEKVTSSRFVKITRPGEIITGYDLESDLEFNHWKLHRVSGIVKTKS